VINILTGPVHSGKTTFLKKSIPAFREKKIRIDGYLSEAAWEKEKFIGYDLIDLKGNRIIPFIRKQGQEEWEKIGSFFFLPETLSLAKRIILRSKKQDLCLVDEVGPLELKGKGVWPALEDILMIPEQDLLLVVRESILKDVIQKMQRVDFVVYDIKKNKMPLRMVESLVRNLEKQRNSGLR
jgi:iron complex transport system ATP-binding protein